MADVSIIVEASLGDTLVKLDLAKHAINDLGDASDETAAKQDAAAASTTLFSGAMNGLTGALDSSVPIFGNVGALIGGLPIVLGLAAVAAVALADAVGSVIAVVADLVAPLILVTGLLGLLGGAFAIAAVKAFGMHSDGFGQAVAGLKKQFDNLTTTLVERFMPIFRVLIRDASDVLSYFNRIAKLPLADAFKSLATTGVQAITKFLEQAGHLLAQPIRLAFKIAFGTGPGGNEISSAVSGLWTQFTNYLFGYTERHPVELRPGVFKIKATTVDGVFQPLIDWFNRHDFSKQGRKIGHSMIDGFLGSGASQKMGQFLVATLEDAFKTVGVAFYGLLHRLSAAFVNTTNSWHDAVNRFGFAALHSIESSIGNAFDWVLTKAQQIWNKIVSIFTAPLHIHLSIPSLPSAGSILHGVTGLIPGISSNTASLAGAGSVHYHTHVTIQGGRFSDAASLRREAASAGEAIARVWRQKAGG
jgi:hypothetical protein